MQQLLKIQNLKTVFDTAKGRIAAVDDVSLVLKNGETLGVVGESGCGKTMLALSLMRLLPANGKIEQGRILFDGEDLLSLSEDEMRKRRGHDMAMIFQEPMTSLNPVLRVGDQIAEAISLHQKISKKEALALSVEQLSEVGIPDPQKRAKDYPHQLSGGMRQRVMIAMAMSCHPRLLLADEPTTALDVTIQSQILRLIADLREKNHMAVILITHDLGIVAEATHKVSVMYAGKIIETTRTEKLFCEPLHPYTQGLIVSRPQESSTYGRGFSGRLQTIPGTVPSLYDRPQGCRFSDRCPKVMPQCTETEPELSEIHEGHFVSCFLYPQTDC